MTFVLLLCLVHLSLVFTGTRATELRAVSRVCPPNPERERELSPPSPKRERQGKEKDPALCLRKKPHCEFQAFCRLFSLLLPGVPGGKMRGRAHLALGSGPNGHCRSGLSFLK